MRSLDINICSNLLDKVVLTSADLERQISTYKLSFSSVRNFRVEWGARFPIFLLSFYNYVIKHNSIPTQEKYWGEYLVDNEKWFKSRQLTAEIMDGLKARIFRTYPSLVRDLHFCLVLKESGKYENIIYDLDLDVVEGIDVLVIAFKGNIFAVNMYTKTRNALHGRVVKESRHVKFDNVNYVELPVAFKGSKEIGDFFLYSDREADILSEKIESLMTQKN